MQREPLITEEVLDQIVRTYAQRLVRLAFTYLKNMADAEDAVQDTFIALMQRTEGFESAEHEKAWLLRVTINKSKNLLRARKVRDADELTDDIGYLPEEDRELLDAVLSLDEHYRSVIHLYYYESYSVAEIAKLLRQNESTVRTWLARGRKQLKTRIGG